MTELRRSKRTSTRPLLPTDIYSLWSRIIPERGYLVVPEDKASRLSREIELSAYIVDEQVLSEVEAIAAAAVGEPEGGAEVRRHYVVSTIKRETISFASLQELNGYLDHHPEAVRSLSLNYSLKRESGLDVVFSTDGNIRISGFSSRPDFSFNVNQLYEFLLTTREDLPWAVRILVFKPHIKKTVALLLPPLSILLLALISYYLHALRVGVNIDPALIPKGNEYYQKVAGALKSNDTNEKLNALLLVQLVGFDNVSNVLISVRSLIFWTIVAIAFLVVLAFGRKVGKHLYPSSFYMFGRNQKAYVSLQGSRQIWGVAIVVGFVVNIAAGFAVALLVR